MSAAQRRHRWWWRGFIAIVTMSSLVAPSLAAAQDEPFEGSSAPSEATSPAGGGSVHDEYLHSLEEEAEVRDAQRAAIERAEELGQQVADLDTRIGEVQQELAAAEAELAQKQAAADETEASLADVEARLVREQQRLRDQAIQAYVGGGATPVPDFVAALKNAGSLEDVAKSQVYAEAVVVDRKAVVKRVSMLRAEADDLSGQAEADRAAAAAARDEVAGRTAELERTRATQADAQAAAIVAAVEQQQLGEQIETRRREYELKYAEQVSQSDSITAMLASWQKDQQPAASTFGIFLNPIKNGRIVSGYGPRVHPIYNERKQHNGLDIHGNMGEPMRASENGLVLLAEERGGYGLTVVIEHGNQLATLYGHMSRLDVKPGDLVQRGQTIGLVGSTGLSTGPHCHWEVRVLGLPVDGTPYLNTAPEP
jgi:murein DD-endopeptidase MepM/ murein hydrolase activator NlpD